MPILELAAAAAGLVGTGFASHLGEQAGDAVGKVVSAIRQRFTDRKDTVGTAALAEIEKAPEDAQLVELLASAVNRHLTDQAFAEELRGLVDTAAEAQPVLRQTVNNWSVTITGNNYGQTIQAERIDTLNIGGSRFTGTGGLEDRAGS